MSDAMSDIVKSEEISGLANAMLLAQKEFLCNPSEDALKKVYEACNNYGHSGSGYWGENPRPLAERIKTHYKMRFGHRKKFETSAEDIAVFFNGIKQEYRLSELSKLFAMASGSGPSEEGFNRRCDQIETYLKHHITISQNENLESKKIAGSDLEGILDSSGIRKAYPAIRF